MIELGDRKVKRQQLSHESLKSRKLRWVDGEANGIYTNAAQYSELVSMAGS